MNSIAPMSTPRVGCDTSSSFGSTSNSRPMISFCWLPPESARAGSVGVRRAHVEAVDDLSRAALNRAVVEKDAAGEAAIGGR